jgi:hypothetical protein
MNPKTADRAAQAVLPTEAEVGPSSETVPADGMAVTPLRLSRRLSGTLSARLGALRADEERMAAVRDSWRALWSSRLLVWTAGVGTILVF